MAARALKTTQLVLALICVMYLIIYVDRTNFGTAAQSIRAEFGLSTTQIGYLFAAFGYPYAALVLFGGYFADRFGARLTFFVCTAVFSVATILTGFATGFASLLAARALLGLGEAPALSTATRAMTNWLPRERWGFGQGITHSFARLGTAVTPPLVALLITHVGWRGSFVVAGVASLVAALVWFSFFRDSPADHPGVTPEELHGLNTTQTRAPSVPVARLAKRFGPLVFSFFCYGWTLWVYLNWLPSFFSQSYGIDLQKSAYYSSAILAAGVVGDTAGGMISDWIYRHTGNLVRARSWLIFAGFIGSVAAMSVLLVSSDLLTVSIALTAAFFLVELAIAPLWLIVMDVAPRYSGMGGGFLSIGFAVAAILSPIAFGTIVDLTGNWRLPFGGAIGLLVLGAIVILFVRPDRPFVEAEA